MAGRRVVALLAALGLSASAAVAQPAVNAHITPKRGHPDTTFRVGFTAPQTAGHQGVYERSYSVELSVRGRGCAQSAATEVTQATAGRRVRVWFKPASRWCLGRGRGSISMTEGPYCNPPDPCPEFPTRTSEIAQVDFRVVRR